MAKANPKSVRLLSQRLQMDENMLLICIEESFVQLEEKGETVDLAGGTALHVRRIQRLAEDLSIDLAVAAILLEKTEKIARLQKEIEDLKRERIIYDKKRS